MLEQDQLVTIRVYKSDAQWINELKLRENSKPDRVGKVFIQDVIRMMRQRYEVK